MSPTAKKIMTADPVARAFEEAEDGAAVPDDDRAALADAAADPRWVRSSRGEAFERLVCEGDEGDHDE